MNEKLSELQVQAIKEWNGEDILSLYPRSGAVGHQSFSSKAEEEWQSTEFWCAMKKLDDLKVPRIDGSNSQTYSVVGRIMWLANNKNK